MSSFTEVVLAFDFRPDTPPAIISAFSAWQVGEGPQLPDFEVLSAEAGWVDDVAAWEDDWPGFLAMLSPMQRASLWQGLLAPQDTAYFPGHPSTALTWSTTGWKLTVRTYAQSTAEGVVLELASLGEFACPVAEADYPTFVGYLYFEADDHPLLVWHRGGKSFEFEDLRVNPDRG